MSLRLATLRNGTPDGQLVLVSADRRTAIPTTSLAATMQQAVERWRSIEEELRAMATALDAGRQAGALPFDIRNAQAPLPRAWQWLDGSAFKSHVDLMATAFAIDPLPLDRPLMYQGISDRFLAWNEDVILPDEAHGIDFEGEFGVIVDQVPMGANRAEARSSIRLIVMINDWSLRNIAPIEMKTGFGWVQAKPACSMAPIAVSPDALGPAWRDCRVALPLQVDLNNALFGRPVGDEMAFGFDELVAHAARTRTLVAGTVIGSGTVSNMAAWQVGSSCIAERRALELLGTGEARTPYMRYGERVRMIAIDASGADPFGPIDQRVFAWASAKSALVGSASA